MRFTETRLRDTYLIDVEPFEDERGFFAVSWSKAEFVKRGLTADIAECDVSFNPNKGTLRGMHYQVAPYAQAKLIRCTSGAIYDVAVDLRSQSATCGAWTSATLTAENRRMLFIPEGIAHGFQTLSNDTEVFYQMSAPYRAESSRGVRWNDPSIGIEWPGGHRIISVRDQAWPDCNY